jgi:threonine dehydratase
MRAERKKKAPPERGCAVLVIAVVDGLIRSHASHNILEVDIRRLFLDVPAKGAKLDITVEARDRVHSAEILSALSEGGYQPMQID